MTSAMPRWVKTIRTMLVAMVILCIICVQLRSYQCHGFTTTSSSAIASTTNTLIMMTPLASQNIPFTNEGGSDDGMHHKQQQQQQQQRRRDALNNMFRKTLGSAIGTLSISSSTTFTSKNGVATALALDMDAFESSVLTKDDITRSSSSDQKSNKMSDDEALCKYGAPGKAMGEACARAQIQRKLPGNVDVSGRVDRGDYLKCRYEYPIIDGQYVKTRVCKPSGEW